MLHQLKLTNTLDMPYLYLIRANVTIYKITLVNAEWEEFLRNTANEIQFINFLSNAFKREKVNVFQSDRYRDLRIVTEAIKLAAGNAITVFFDNTDVLVLLMHHRSPFCVIYALIQKELLTKRKYKNNGIFSWQKNVSLKLTISYLHLF